MKDFICCKCNGTFPPHMQYEVNGELLCPNCAEWHTRVCIDCGDRFPASENKGSNDKPLCSPCWNRYLFGKEAERHGRK